MGKNNIFRKEALERLSSPEQLDQLMQIVTPRSWLPLATLGGLLVCGLVWSFVGRIPVTTSGRGVMVYTDPLEEGQPSQGLVGVAYFRAGEIAQIQPGMEVLLIPDVEGAQVAGGLMAKVESVSNPTVTTISAARETGRDESFVEVVTVPEMEANGDYHWSTGRSMMAPIAGMPAIARVTLEEKAPITFVFPFLSRTMDQESG
ncbi:MAG: hypothetical protein AAGC93_12490 [Cyanobacteria bacterium P01_F01_bin.53]